MFCCYSAFLSVDPLGVTGGEGRYIYTAYGAGGADSGLHPRGPARYPYSPMPQVRGGTPLLFFCSNTTRNTPSIFLTIARFYTGCLPVAVCSSCRFLPILSAADPLRCGRGRALSLLLSAHRIAAASVAIPSALCLANLHKEKLCFISDEWDIRRQG